MKTKEPKYKVGDVVQYKREYDDGNSIGIFRIDRIEKDKYGRFVYYRDYSKSFSGLLYEDEIIGKMDYNKEEYELYLKLKEKYGDL